MSFVNFELLRAIKERGLSQRAFARIVGEHESVVSRVVNGVWIVDPIRAKEIRAGVEEAARRSFRRIGPWLRARLACQII
jgi:hypothetical protein